MNKTSRYHQNNAQLLDEQKMIAAAKTDPKNFELLYKKYHEPIFRYIYQRMDDKEMAFDITTNVFVKGLLNIQKFEYKGVPFSAWLFRIAKSELYQAFKNKKAERTINVDNEHLSHIAEELNETDNHELLRKQLLNHISTLPETDLQLIELRFFEDRSFREIGEILEMNENNAKVKCFRALQKLKKQLNIVRN